MTPHTKRFLLRALLALAVLPFSLSAQAPTITFAASDVKFLDPTTPVTAVYQGHPSVIMEIAATVSNWNSSLRAGLLIRTELEDGRTSEQRVPSSRVTWTAAGTNRFTLRFNFAPGNYPIPPVTCYPTCTTQKVLAETVQKIKKMEVIVLAVTSADAELSRTGPLPIPLVENPKVDEYSPLSQPVFSERTFHVKVSSGKFTQARFFRVALLNSNNTDLALAHAYDPPSSGSNNACGDLQTGLPSFGACRIQIIDDRTLEMTVRTFPSPGIDTSSLPRSGSWDILVQWDEEYRPGGSITRYAILLRAYQIISPEGSLDIEELRITAAGQQYAFKPGGNNIVLASPGQTLQFTVKFSYLLTRAGARVWLLVRRPDGAALVRNPRAIGLFFSNSSQRVESTTSQDSFTLPSPSGLLEFLLVFGPPDDSSTYPADRIFAPSSPVQVFYGTEPPKPDLKVDHVELVQVTQDKFNSIPLIAGKRTVARVFVTTGDFPVPDVPGVRGVIQGVGHKDKDGKETKLTDEAQVINNVTTASRLNLNYRALTGPPGPFTFLLPDTWTEEGETTFKVIIDPERRVPEIGTDNNTKEFTFQFQKAPPLRVGYAKVCFQDPKAFNLYTICAKPSRRDADFMRKIFPIDQNTLEYGPLGIDYVPVPPKDVELLNELSPFGGGRFGFLLEVLKAELRSSFDNTVIWYADPGGLIGDGRTLAFKTSLSTLRFSKPQVDLPYRMGLIYGLRGIAAPGTCLSSGDPNSVLWPYRDATIQEVGFDPSEKQVIGPDSKDLMSRCDVDQLWISPLNYRKLIDSMFKPSASRASADDPRQGVGELLLMSGTVRRDGSTAQLDPVFRVPSSSAVQPSSGSGAYCLVLSGSAGTLGQTCFDLTFVGDQASFGATMASAPGATRLALRFQGRDLAVRTASRNAPALTITSPQPNARWEAGRQTISWTGSDADGDRLSYYLLYSSDGGQSWLPLTLETTELKREVNTAGIQGGSNVFFRVLASDGFLTTEQRVGPITVVQRPAIAVTPAVVEAVGVPAGQGRDVTFTIHNTGSGPLRVDSITSDNSSFTVVSPGFPMTVEADGEGDVVLLYRPAGTGGESGTVTVRSNAPGQETFLLTVRGSGGDPNAPSIAVGATSLDFGEISVGQTKELSLAIRNAGLARLSAQVQVTRTGFRVEPASLDLDGGAQGTLRLTFAPASPDDLAANLTLTSNDPQRPSVDVELRGIGVAGGPVSQPRISAGGIVNAANFRAPISRGSIASLFGSNLAGATLSATSLPLPARLGGLSVSVDGVEAPLFFVSPSQVNFQVPFGATVGSNIPVVAVRNGVASEAASVAIVDNAPGVFTYQRAPGAVDPIILHLNGELVTPSNPAQAGEIVLVFATGLGDLMAPPPTGYSAAANPLALARQTPSVTLGGEAVETLFAGLTPGFVGLAQLNLQLPARLPGGSSLPLAIRFGDGPVATVNLAVR